MWRFNSEPVEAADSSAGVSALYGTRTLPNGETYFELIMMRALWFYAGAYESGVLCDRARLLRSAPQGVPESPRLQGGQAHRPRDRQLSRVRLLVLDSTATAYRGCDRQTGRDRVLAITGIPADAGPPETTFEVGAIDGTSVQFVEWFYSSSTQTSDCTAVDVVSGRKSDCPSTGA